MIKGRDAYTAAYAARSDVWWSARADHHHHPSPGRAEDGPRSHGVARYTADKLPRGFARLFGGAAAALQGRHLVANRRLAADRVSAGRQTVNRCPGLHALRR